MKVPLEIHFQNVDHSPALEQAIREHVTKLEQFTDHIISCRVAVEIPHRHHRRGNLYRIAVDLRLPGGEVVASRDHADRQHHQDVYVALRDAFKAVRRQLQDQVRVQSGKIKVHETAPVGIVSEMHPEEDYGRITTPDGRDIYFHRNSVVDADFGHLQPGMAVRFAEEEGDRGPQASTVHVVSKAS